MAVRVYFNQWFSSISTVIEDLKKRWGESIYIIGSSLNKNHAYKEVCDEFVVEKDFSSLSDAEARENCYIELMLNICTEHNVDVFFVRKNAKLIAKNRKIFENFGIKLVLENLDLMELLDSKSMTYEALQNDFSEYIPNFINTRGLPGDLTKNTLYDIVHKSGCDGEPLWCFKLDSDEGGCSYRLIEADSDINFSSLKKCRFNKMTKSEAIDLINNCSAEELNQLIFMEQLKSPEISVDCYNSAKGFIAICREKIENTRHERMYVNKTITDVCRRISNTLGIQHIFNVQFMLDSAASDSALFKNMRLLEINARMSGGTYYQTLLGLNLADIELHDIIGDTNYDIDNYLKFEESTVTHVEQAIKLEK